MTKIPTKFATTAVIPSEILPDDRMGKIPCETIDGKKCYVTIVGTAHLVIDSTARRLDKDCQRLYGKSFEFVSDVWRERLHHDVKWWDIVKMEEM